MTVPTFVYCPSIAVPVAVQVMVPDPTASVVPGQLTAPSLSSVTAMFDSGTLPMFLTVYVHVTTLPVATTTPGAVLLSLPFVFFTRETPATAIISPKLLFWPFTF